MDLEHGGDVSRMYNTARTCRVNSRVDDVDIGLRHFPVLVKFPDFFLTFPGISHGDINIY